jgi:phosphoribosyl 1,2-cyclic phosphate phosphodiesterase
MSVKITFLGTGTSSGIPTIGCSCHVCNSDDPKDKRLRSSILIEHNQFKILIDTSPDLRQQMLKYNVKKIDAVIYTHHHFDHIGGFDDIRAFNYTSRRVMPVYLMEETLRNIKKTFFYAFSDCDKPGGGVPVIDVNIIDDKPFSIGGLEIIPIPLYHGKMKVLGFRIGDFAYCTDTNNIPPESMKLLLDLKIFVLDALRYTWHDTHFKLDDAVKIAKEVSAETTYFIHMAHEIKHSDCEASLPKNMKLAYDGLVIHN